MLHAIGADYKKARKYRDHRYYHAYRNYYDAGGHDKELWEDLTGIGAATWSGVFYKVSRMGLRVLESITGCTIYDNRQNVADCRQAALEWFMRQETAVYYGCWFPNSTKMLAHALVIPVPLARKTIHALEEEGLLRKGHYGDIDDEGFPHCVHGYYLTKKAKELPRYKEIKEEEERKLDEELQRNE